MSRIIGCIIEIRLGPDHSPKGIRKAVNKANNMIVGLDGKKSIGGYVIGGVLCDKLWSEIDDPCIIPDFGHNADCKCENPEPNGVLRCFGVDLAVEGYPTASEIFGTWELSEDIRMTVSMMSNSMNNENPEPLKRLSYE